MDSKIKNEIKSLVEEISFMAEHIISSFEHCPKSDFMTCEEFVCLEIKEKAEAIDEFLTQKM